MKAVPNLEITQLWHLKFGKFLGILRAWINGAYFSYNYGGPQHKFFLMQKYLRITLMHHKQLRITLKILYASQTTWP